MRTMIDGVVFIHMEADFGMWYYGFVRQMVRCWRVRSSAVYRQRWGAWLYLEKAAGWEGSLERVEGQEGIYESVGEVGRY